MSATINKIEPLKYILRSCLQDITPVRLRLLLVANSLGIIVFCFLALSTIKHHQHVVKTLGFDAGPSVIAAGNIQIGIEQMDISLLTQLVVPYRARNALWAAAEYDKWLANVCRSLVAAAKNITYGISEQTPIENLQIALGKYEMESQQARDMHDLGKKDNMINYYRQALNTLEQNLLPNAAALHKTNTDNLESTYGEEESKAALSCGLVAVIGILEIGLLAFTQIYLFKRFRRRFNLPLLISVCLLVVFVQHLYSTLMNNSKHLKIAKEDAYNSINALLDARVNAYRANASVGRWLIDKDRAQEYEKTFLEKSNSVASFSTGHRFTEIIDKADKQLNAEEKLNLPGFSGSLADEMNNVRFAGEGQAALEALQAFSDFQTAVKLMYQFKEQSAQISAMEIGLGYEPYAARFAFTKFDDAVERMLKINQYYFNRAIHESIHDLKGLTITAQSISLLILFCIYIGLRPRMAEYVRPS